MLATCCSYAPIPAGKAGSKIMERADIIVYFDQIPEEGLERHVRFSRDDLGQLKLSVALEGVLDARVKLHRIGRRVLLKGTLAGSMDLECSRCLGRFSFPFAGAFETYLEVAPSRESEEEKELSRDDLDVQPLRGGAVDLGEIIAEQVHLVVPYKALCSESCRGMCSQCGADLNANDCSCSESGTDPRWDALRDLKVR